MNISDGTTLTTSTAIELKSGLSSSPSLPAPPDDTDLVITEAGCRLWVGNLDSRITEFSVLKLLQKHGTLNQFDFIYHKTGPDAGKSKGYCFATYSTREEAESAKLALDGKLALSRKLQVRNANINRKEDMKSKLTFPKTATASAKPSQNPLRTTAQIRAIEQKLKRMEQGLESKPSFNTSHQSHDRSHGQQQHQGHRYQSQSYGQIRGSSQGHSRYQPYSRGGHR